MDIDEQTRLNEIYKNIPLDKVPWNKEAPPQLLVELVETCKVEPCRAIDLGCGAGNYAIYLAQKGFDVTGVDISQAAIEIARKSAGSKGLKCNFFVADVVEELSKLNRTWDFACDWGLLHHILPEKRHKYVEGVYRILNPKGKYLSVCFSEKDAGFGGSGKYRKTRLGTVLYFSSKDELRELFEEYFQIIELWTDKIEGKFEPHTFNCAFMERR